MARSFKLPDLGEGIHEGEVLAVHVKTGQEVAEGDIIFEVETDKAAVEIPSPFSGKVAEILVGPGDMVNVGDVLITFENGTASEAEPIDKTKAAEETVAVEAKDLTAASPNKGPVPASPATRKLARELKVDLHLVVPSAASGVVSADDVRNFSARETGPAETEEKVAQQPEAKKRSLTPAIDAPALPDFAKWGKVKRVRMRSIRRATARQMTLSWSQIPHVTSQDTVDVTKLEAFRQDHKDQIEKAGGKLTLTVFALKAVATALKEFPNFNASLDMAAQEIIQKDYFHIGVAVNTDDGLIVPVIRDVERKSIKELSLEMTQLVTRTRNRKVSIDEMRGGSFTITNAGAMGGGLFSPIINYPEVAILGMGLARMQPVVVRDKKGAMSITPRLMMPLVLTIDHRILDGVDAISFLNSLKNSLQDPDELLMNMV